MQDKNEFAKELIFTVWDGIDFKKMPKTRMMGIYGELSGKIKYAASSATIEMFLSKLAKRFGVRSLTNKYNILEKKKRFNDKEILRYIRQNTEYIIIFLREEVERRKEEYKQKQKELKERVENEKSTI